MVVLVSLGCRMWGGGGQELVIIGISVLLALRRFSVQDQYNFLRISY